MNALLEGSILGLSLAFIFGFGPAFFALVQTAINRGFGAGVLMAIGIFLNDLFVVVVTVIPVMFGAESLFSDSENYKVMGIIGGSLLLIFGVVTFKRKEVAKESEEKVNGEPHSLIYMAKGFLLNLANPFVWLFWFTVSVSAAAGYKANTYELVLFFSGTLGVVLITDILKVFTASRLTRFLTDKFLIMINKVAGSALILFGAFLIFRSIFNF